MITIAPCATYLTAVAIVEHAIAPYQANVLGDAFRVLVLAILYLLLDGAQITGFLHYLRVVSQTQALVVHWIPEDSALLPSQKARDDLQQIIHHLGRHGAVLRLGCSK